MDTSRAISPTLETDPALNFSNWYQSVKIAATGILSDEYGYGLLHLVVTPAVFAALPGNVDAAGADDDADDYCYDGDDYIWWWLW